MDSNSPTTPQLSSAGLNVAGSPPTDSTSASANDPLINLLRLRKDKPVMTDDERRAAVMQLRELRTSPQSLGRAMRQSAAQKVQEDEEELLGLDVGAGSPSVTKKKKPSVKVEVKDLYKTLGL